MGALAEWLREQGVKPGDVIGGFLPNGTDAVLAMLATSAVGAIWTSCSPDFGVSGLLDRFGQTQPKIIFCVDSYFYNGKCHDAWDKVQSIAPDLVGLTGIVRVRYGHSEVQLDQSTCPAFELDA